ncbi:hypothetical protein NUM3379_38700 [Kineococcus sp. NUM-3379]
MVADRVPDIVSSGVRGGVRFGGARRRARRIQAEQPASTRHLPVLGAGHRVRRVRPGTGRQDADGSGGWARPALPPRAADRIGPRRSGARAVAWARVDTGKEAP